MNTIPETSLEGGCTCRAIRYRMTSRPIIVHCCHCSWCQRETGASFALNAMIESDRIVVTGAEPDLVITPSASSKGQPIARCPACRIALWSHYHQSGDRFRFVRVGTLDVPAAFPPDVHIYTSTRQPWVVLPPGARAFAEFYNPAEVWAADALARFRAARAS